MPAPAQAFYTGATPPSNPSPGAVWLSDALAHARFPNNAGQITRIAGGGPGSTVAQSEPRVFLWKGVICLITSGIQLYTCTDPRGPKGKWDYKGQIFGRGVGGESEYVAHSRPFLEDGILYLHYSPQGASNATMKCAFVPLDNIIGPTPSIGWTVVGAILPNGAGMPPGVAPGLWGNPAMFKVGSQYRMYQEAVYGGALSWQAAMYVSSAPQGPFTMETSTINGLHPSSTLWTNPENDSFSNAPAVAAAEGYHDFIGISQPVFENGRHVMIYFAGPQSAGGESLLSSFYRGFSYDGGYSWEVDNGGYPIHVPSHHMLEGNGIGDPGPILINGKWWCFWSGGNDRENATCVLAAPLAPTWMTFDGYDWNPVEWVGPIGLGYTRSFSLRTRYAIFGGAKVRPYEDIAVDPGNTTNQPLTLPKAWCGAEFILTNISTGTGTVLTSADPEVPSYGVTDVVLGSNPAITPGQSVLYRCRTMGRWARQG